MIHTIVPVACTTCGQCQFCDPLGCDPTHGPVSSGDIGFPPTMDLKCSVLNYDKQRLQWAWDLGPEGRRRFFQAYAKSEASCPD